MNRAPTKRMTEVLMDCHERELLKLDPYEASMIPSVAGLVKRGLVTTHTYITKNGKKIYALFITGEGINYLQNIL